MWRAGNRGPGQGFEQKGLGLCADFPARYIKVPS
jgi:hypothetical protein